MTSDIETIKAILDKRGIRYLERPHAHGAPGKHDWVELQFDRETTGDRLQGYSGFIACLVFDAPTGDLDHVESWE